MEFEGNYINGKILGEVVSYYEDGTIKSKNDSLGNEFYYYKNGKLLRKKEKNKEAIYFNKEGEEVPFEDIKSEL